MHHIMIDLETTDTLFTAGILSIGAVKYNPSTGEQFDTFYRRLGIEQAQCYGTTSESTMRWWNKQDPAVRRESFTGLHEAFISAHELAEFCKGAKGVWGNGATFDISILDHWYHALGMSPAWGFNVRDCRTVEMLAEMIGVSRRQWTRRGYHHNALDDAIYQAEYISGMWQKLTIAQRQELSRAEFERIFGAAPYEFKLQRYPERAAWPGNYVDYNVQCAWVGYKTAALASGIDL